MAFAQLGNIQLYFERAGDGPPLLFISGTGGDLRVKPNVFDGPLAKQFDLLAYDQRGLGQSEKPDIPYSMADYADDAAALMTEQGLDEALVLGVSFGGMVAQELVLRHPERVKRLVLACTSPGGDGGASFPFHEIEHLKGEPRARYMIPEQRVLKIARIGPDQVANISATPQEIEAYYKAHQDVYGAKDIRTIDQAVVPDQKVAAGIAQRARSGQSFVDAVKPAGLGAGDVQLGPQTRDQFKGVAGDKVAAAAFAAKSGEVLGPVQSPLGWHVIKIESSQTQVGKSLAQASSEISAQVTSDKRKEALADLVDKVQDQLDGGANFDETVKATNLQVTTTPLITATGAQRGNVAFKFPQDLLPALKTGFEIAPTDEPVVEQLADDKGFALVAPAQVIQTAPAPLASIRDRVKSDWIQGQALARARAAADSIAAKARGKGSLADAMKSAGTPLPGVQPVQARRIQLSQLGDKVPEPLRVLFSSAQGTTKVGADPQGRGFFIVKVDKITPGNALGQPGLINEVQNEFAQPLAQEYAQQFLAAIKTQVKVRRNETAIAAAKKRITASGQ